MTHYNNAQQNKKIKDPMSLKQAKQPLLRKIVKNYLTLAAGVLVIQIQLKNLDFVEAYVDGLDVILIP